MKKTILVIMAIVFSCSVARAEVGNINGLAFVYKGNTILFVVEYEGYEWNPCSGNT